MDLDQMAYRCPKAEMVETVRLEGYRLTLQVQGAALLPSSRKREAMWTASSGH